MNTRLQVEHPVTEMVTGIDLVEQQILIASGESLPFKQEDIRIRGSAIECRVYAEDPHNSFFPSPGRITFLRRPSGPGVRDDSGVYEGWTVPIDYDPLISKLIVWAGTRDKAIARMKRALGEYQVEGIQTNLGFFVEILDHQDFRKGELDTGFIDRWLETSKPATPAPQTVRDLAAIAAALAEMTNEPGGPLRSSPAAAPESPWKRVGRARGLRT
jgi:acetyl-CoA carboxylase biotin carboxylase subunit